MSYTTLRGHINRLRGMNLMLFPPQSQYGFFANLVPIPFGVESVKQLIDSNLYDPNILTTPSTKNPLCYTEKRIWIEKHFGLEFIISPNKSLVLCQKPSFPYIIIEQKMKALKY